jgi:hypothetical protein
MAVPSNFTQSLFFFKHCIVQLFNNRNLKVHGLQIDRDIVNDKLGELQLLFKNSSAKTQDSVEFISFVFNLYLNKVIDF